MEHKTQKTTSWADARTLDVVRPEVRRILESTPAFRKLPEEEKRSIASQMVKVAAYMANPDGLVADAPEGAEAVALAEEEDPVTATKRRLSQAPGFAGKDFQAGALRAGTQEFGELVKKVDFPKFVGGLIENVFQAIVESSIQQMKAYGELLANVAKTVDQFARDNISENNARDWLVERFPDQLELDTSQAGGSLEEGEPAPAQAHLRPRDDVDPAGLIELLKRELNVQGEVGDLSDEETEAKVITAARLQMARSRQQLLASMVMLGINRIVVTSGLIHAKVVFDMQSRDTARRKAQASMLDSQETKSRFAMQGRYGGWWSPWRASMDSSTESTHMATVESSVDETSESRAETKAKLSGEVRVQFKSDYLPMEKLASPKMMAVIQGNAKPVDINEPQEAPTRA